jgi:tetratricopeptide (TPR) repeat protein
MPTLYNWFEREYERLETEGKGELVKQFDAFRRAFLDYEYRAALDAIPVLHELTDALGEPGMRLATDYYRMAAETYWLGNLAHGLDIATQSTVRARSVLYAGEVLELYLRIDLLFAWLDTDGPGYAAEVLAAFNEMPGYLPRDLAVRFKILHVYDLMHGGATEEALAMIFAILSELGEDWPRPFHHFMRADALARVGRLEEALADYRTAMQGFNRMGHTIEGVAMQINAGSTLVEMGRVEEGLEALEAAYSAAGRSLNRAHVGMAQGAIGGALTRLECYAEAVEWFTGALGTLDGLGWLRLEAELALERLRVARQWGGAAERWGAWESDAWRRVGYLRSTDLRDELAGIDGE